jgi:hypothetical protein
MLGILLKIGITLGIKQRHASGLRTVSEVQTQGAVGSAKPGRVIKHAEN